MKHELRTKVRVKGYGHGVIISRTFEESPRFDVKLSRYDCLVLRDVTEDRFLPQEAPETVNMPDTSPLMKTPCLVKG